MEDIELLKQLAPLLQAGGSAALIAGIFIGYKVLQVLYAIDKRLTRVEIHLGLDPDAPPPRGGNGARIAATAGALILLLPMLGGCSVLSGEVLGASVTVGGFTVGLSGKFPGATAGEKQP